MLEEIFLEKPDIVAISVYIWNVDAVGKLICDLKKILPQIKIILGGPEVSFNAQKWLDNFFEIDYIISGAGEAGLKYLVENNFNLTNKIVCIPNPHFSEIPFPYIERDFEVLKHKYIYYESSRGCPFKCSYCLSSRIDQRLQYKPLVKVKKELSFLMKQSCDVVKFVDRTFNADRKFAREVWRFLIKNYDEKKRYHFEIHPALLEEEDFQILASSPKDYFQFEMGVQSTNVLTLKSINRHEKWLDIKKNIARLIALRKSHIHLDLITGLPYEDMRCLENSFNDIYGMKSDLFQLGFLKVLPGTEMEERKEEYGIVYSASAPYQILANKWLSFKEFSLLHRLEGVMESYYNSGKFKFAIASLEKLYNSPFRMFMEITVFKDENGIGELKDWEKNATVLLDFIAKKFEKQREYFIDCLSYDWYLLGRFAHTPSILKNEFSGKLNKKMLSNFAAVAQNNILNLAGEEISMKALKQAAFFKPQSQKFREKMTEEKRNILFYKVEGLIKSVNYND